MDEEDEGMEGQVKQGMIRDTTESEPRSVDSPPPRNYQLDIVEGVLIVKRRDGAEVLRLPKGDWAYGKATTCVKCAGNVKPPATPDFIPCC